MLRLLVITIALSGRTWRAWGSQHTHSKCCWKLPLPANERADFNVSRQEDRVVQAVESPGKLAFFASVRRHWQTDWGCWNRKIKAERGCWWRQTDELLLLSDTYKKRPDEDVLKWRPLEALLTLVMCHQAVLCSSKWREGKRQLTVTLRSAELSMCEW